MKKKQKLVVLGIIQNTKGEILVSQRLDPKIQELKWMIPEEAVNLDLLPTTKEFVEIYIDS